MFKSKIKSLGKKQPRVEIPAKPSERVGGQYEDVLLPALPDIPSMVNPIELRYLYWLLTRRYSGAGAVVEVGPWMGKSTCALAAGLKDSGHAGKIHTFDKFKWRVGGGWEKKIDFELKPGHSFMPLFQKNTADFSAYIQAYQSDMGKIKWRGGDIEVIFLDAPKQPRQITQVLKVFAPSLVPDGSYIVCQDYFHPPSFALPAARAMFGADLELVHTTYKASTAGFVVRGELKKNEIKSKCFAHRNWSQDEAERRWAAMEHGVPEAKKTSYRAALAFLLSSLGCIDRACEIGLELGSLRPRFEKWKTTHLGEQYAPLFRVVLEQTESAS